jgi:hypothetical protein
MWQRPSRGQYVEILLFTLSSLLLYHTGVGFLLFLVPLQVVASRRGIRGLALAAAAFFLVFLAIRFWPTAFSPSHALPDVLSSIEIGIAGVCLLGMLVVNLPLARRPRTRFLLAGAAGIAGVVLVPLGLAVSRMPAFQQSMDQLFAEVSRTFSTVFAPAADGGAASFFSQMVQPARLRAMTEATLLRSFLADFLVLISFSWWAGQAAARRRPAFAGSAGSMEGFRFSSFRLESGWLWPLILSGALVLADLFFGISRLGLPWLAYAAWNVGLALLFLFGLQGMAIVMFVFEKYRLPRILWLLLVAGILVLAASPGAGVFIVLAIPVLGISENWIRLRIPRRAAPTE